MTATWCPIASCGGRRQECRASCRHASARRSSGNADPRRAPREDNTMLRFLSCWRLATALVLMQVQAPAQAQGYPSRPVTIIVPLAAGTGMDTLVRLYGEQLAQALGKPVVVENKPGAATMLGVAAVASALADGHTLLVATSSSMAINPVLYKKIIYDPERDFVPISFYVKSPFVLVVNPELPVRSVPDLIRFAKESTAPLAYSSPGAGTALHLSVEFMKQRFGLAMTHV